ncbi:hypothetical protein TrRE_jg3088, partial [Triparma retinervis]
MMSAVRDGGMGVVMGVSREESLQLSSILLIKALISTRWKPRGGMLRKKTVQVDTAHVAGVRVTPQELTPDTKNYLRETLIFTLQIPPPLPFSSAIRNSICAIVAKIGRSDTASDFPALLPTLLQSLPGNNFTTNCLNKLLKELSMQRILLHKKNFALISSSSFPIVMKLFTDYCNQLSPALTSADPTGLMSVNQDLLLHFKIMTKIANKLLVNTLPSLLSTAETVNLVGLFFSSSLTLLDLLCAALLRIPTDHPVHITLLKVLSRLASTAVETQANYPLQFAPFLAPHLSFFHRALVSCTAAKHP